MTNESALFLDILDVLLTVSCVLTGLIFLSHAILSGISKRQPSKSASSVLLSSFVISLFLIFVSFFYPTSHVFYIVNGSNKEQTILIDNSAIQISPKTSVVISSRLDDEKHITLKENRVEALSTGIYLINLSDDIKIDYQYIPYTLNRSETQYEIDRKLEAIIGIVTPRGKGIYKITSKLDDQVFTFDEQVPLTQSRAVRTSGPINDVYKLSYVEF